MRGKRFILSVFFLLLLVAGSVYQYRKYRVAPDFDISLIKATDLSGKMFNAARYRNKPLIILYFATWCIDCRRELPQLEDLREELTRKNINVLLFSDEEASRLKPFEQSLPEGFHLYRLQGSFKESGIYTLPTSYLLKQNGQIFLQKTGAIDWSADLIHAFIGS
jgi:thiol-disulfide isomerase/thioredoxin